MIGIILWPMYSTPPAPFVFALLACHMSASEILLNEHSTVRASLGACFLDPLVLIAGLSLLARLPLVPRSLALEAKEIIACIAFDFCGICLGTDYLLTLRVRAVDLVAAHAYLIISFES